MCTTLNAVEKRCGGPNECSGCMRNGWRIDTSQAVDVRRVAIRSTGTSLLYAADLPDDLVGESVWATLTPVSPPSDNTAA